MPSGVRLKISWNFFTEASVPLPKMPSVLGDPVQRHLNNDHIGSGAAPAQGRAGIGGGVAPDGGVGYDLHIPVITAENLGGVVALQRQILAAPLAETLAGDGGAVAEFGSQGLYKAGPAEVVVEQFIHDPGDVVKEAAAVDEKLVIGGGIGDIEIIAPAAVEFRINSVQGKGNDGENIGPEGTFLPGGVDFAGGYVFDVVSKGYRHIGRRSRGGAQMDGDGFGNDGQTCGHGCGSFLWGWKNQIWVYR